MLEEVETRNARLVHTVASIVERSFNECLYALRLDVDVDVGDVHRPIISSRTGPAAEQRYGYQPLMRMAGGKIRLGIRVFLEMDREQRPSIYEC
jgi:hypothetical protein